MSGSEAQLGPSAATGSNTSGLTYPYSLTFQSNASVAIIIVVLGATFFFMFLFLVYIKRCGDGVAAQGGGSGGGGGGDGGGLGGWTTVHGLDPEVLKKFPIMRYASVKHKAPPTRDSGECAVCLGQFEESERLRLLPACGHSFHPECIDMWLETHSTCPLCRRSLDHDADLEAQLGSTGDAASAANAAGAENPVAGDLQGDRQHEDNQQGQQQQQQGQQDQQQATSIIRTLSRNSESFKCAAHEAELREVRERLRASSSGRFGGSSPSTNPSPLARLMSMRGGGGGGGGGGRGRPPVAPVAVHHSQSCSDLATRSANQTVEMATASPRGDDDLECGGSRSDRWAAAPSSPR